MHRTLFALLALTLAAPSTAAGASGAESARPKHQSSGAARSGLDGVTLLRLHVGITTPTGNLSDSFDTGLGLGASVAYGVSRTVLLSFGAAYHNFNGDGFDGDATIVPLTMNVEGILPSSGKVHPWISGGFGFYNIDVESNAIFVPPAPGATSVSETNTGISLGAGIGSRSGDNDVWGVGFRYHHIFEGDEFNDLDFITFQAAYGFFL
jgi:hypothetical protein